MPQAQTDQDCPFIVIGDTYVNAARFARILQQRLDIDVLPTAYPAANTPRLTDLEHKTVYLIGDHSKPSEHLERFYSWIRDADALGVKFLNEDDIYAGRA